MKLAGAGPAHRHGRRFLCSRSPCRRSTRGCEYVRAAAEGGMVGALADWFAVTALFKYPMGIKIPHTAIIPRRKDQIGASLGEFVETNFLSEAGGPGEARQREHCPEGRRLAVRPGRRRAGGEGGCRRHPRRVQGVERRRRPGSYRGHGPQAPARSAVGTAGGHGWRSGFSPTATTTSWLTCWWTAPRTGWATTTKPSAGWSRTAPRTWVPQFVDGLVGDKVYVEILKFTRAVQSDPHHQVRQSHRQVPHRPGAGPAA